MMIISFSIIIYNLAILILFIIKIPGEAFARRKFYDNKLHALGEGGAIGVCVGVLARKWRRGNYEGVAPSLAPPAH